MNHLPAILCLFGAVVQALRLLSAISSTGSVSGERVLGQVEEEVLIG